MKSMTQDEKKWRAESDARTMAEYEQIMKDTGRRRAAISAAKGMATDLNRRASAMNRVANTKSKKK